MYLRPKLPASKAGLASSNNPSSLSCKRVKLWNRWGMLWSVCLVLRKFYHLSKQVQHPLNETATDSKRCCSIIISIGGSGLRDLELIIVPDTTVWCADKGHHDAPNRGGCAWLSGIQSLIDDISIALKQNEKSLLLLKIANVAVVGFTYTNLVYAKADGFPCWLKQPMAMADCRSFTTCLQGSLQSAIPLLWLASV